MTIVDAVQQVLADRNWHPIAEVFRAARPLVDPGRAYRRYLLEQGTSESMDQAVRWGQRRIVQYYLANYKYCGTIEARGYGPEREYRLIAERVGKSRKGINGKATGKT